MVKLFKALMASFLIATLAACGGGGGSAGTPVQGGGTGTGGTGTTANGQINVTLVDSTGAANNVLSSSSGLTAKATVVDAIGAAAKNVVVTFTVDSAIATLSPVSGTALTDSNGVAQITLKPGTGVGAGTLTASAVVVGSNVINGKIAYSVASIAAIPSAINFTSAVPADKSIVIKGSGGNGRTEAALLSFTVVDSANVGIANAKVNFSLPATNSVTLGATSGVTDAAGKVSVTVNSGSTPTTVRVVATVDGTAISALSDTVTVTTGQPTQSAMSVAHEKSDVEGMDRDGETNQITVSMADQFGGVVADGTPAVFTTNSGAIVGDGNLGGSDTARCLTVKGTCFVTWRSQNPRASVVTVVVTSANATETLTGSSSFVNSGSFAKISSLPSVDATDCKEKDIAFQVTDEYGYIMPAGTTITIENAGNLPITVYPATILAPTTTNAGGTTHTLIIKQACGTTGSVTTITPVVVVTTPKGGVTKAPFNATYISP